MKVRLVTPWTETPFCGIRSHSEDLIAAVKALPDCEIDIVPDPAGLDPSALLYAVETEYSLPLIHLNYHAALHSRWGVEQIAKVQALGGKVIITYHDTGVPNSDQCRALHAAADAFVVHEPAEDLPGAHYWRMGVREWPRAIPLWSQPRRPILGTAGFDFGWKCYDELARVTAANGWSFLICCPEMSAERWATLRRINPWMTGVVGRPQADVIAALAGCDATAFTYVCHNTGQSAAILLGIAARKPVIALSTCRQMRALYLDPLGREAIRWAETFEQVGAQLRRVVSAAFDSGIVALAEQERWPKIGRQYADLYRSLSR